ncbi:ABC transporter ATP-binding protein [Staphylococcus massiliensis]|uniref:ABC transporter ATP-binding protein n=1 Tax=Staphylococcus massiliensis TaxID=555791 RepID=UPI001EE0C8C9|nr:ABC transporter ATP-binding protein [Staphylococcus massiliensis]MCG3413637.1 ABC transporter ATP-binding protein [Staphylococcus massiliensis]
MNITLKNVTKKFQKDTYALKNINMDLNEKEIVGIIGPNGAGKTTLMKILSGLIINYSGEKSVSPKNIVSFGNLIESPKYFPNKTGYYNLKYFAKLQKKDIQSFSSVIESLDLSNYLHKKVTNYSIGMKQRLGVAIAIICSNNLLILDEPTNGMDPNGKRDFLNFIKNISQKTNMLILISSHNLEEISEIADKIYIMKNGEIVDYFINSSVSYIKIQLNSHEMDEARGILKKTKTIDFQNNTIRLFNKDYLKDVLKLLSDNNIYPENISEENNNLKDIYFSKTGDK